MDKSLSLLHFCFVLFNAIKECGRCKTTINSQFATKLRKISYQTTSDTTMVVCGYDNNLYLKRKLEYQNTINQTL